MPAPARYPSFHEQLSRLAAEARTDGVPFEVFWREVVRPGKPPITFRTEDPPMRWSELFGRPLPTVVVWPTDTGDRNECREAAEYAREAWRRAYEGVPPTRGEQALALLAPLLDRMSSARGFDADQPVRSAA